MASFVTEHDNIGEAVILEVVNQDFGIVRTRDGRVRRAIGMESAIGIPEHAKAPPSPFPNSLPSPPTVLGKGEGWGGGLDHEETVPTCMVRINHPDRTGEILSAIAEGLFGRINKPHFNSVFVRLFESEGHSGLCVFA